jgi:hypothetical protein
MNGTTTLARRLRDSSPARWGLVTTLVGMAAVALTASISAAPAAAPERAAGWRAKLGGGEVSSFAELESNGAPRAVGVAISGQALASLPTTHSDGHHCTDLNGDGHTDRAAECFPTHEFVIPLPDAVNRRDDMPFKWVLLNWNLHGHGPPGIYDAPHFDVHFYMTSIAEVLAIKPGPCGPEMVDCDAFERAKAPLADGLMHPDFKDVDAVAPAMGNHLIDVSGPEFQGVPWTRSFIYGVFDGRVTFYEEMVSLAYLLGRPDACEPIKATPAVDTDGYYPTRRCVRYDARADAYTVSLEGFVYREASRAAAPRQADHAHNH